MTTYNLMTNEKEILELALNALITYYDQFKIKDPELLKRLRRKVRECTKVTLTTEVRKPNN